MMIKKNKIDKLNIQKILNKIESIPILSSSPPKGYSSTVIYESSGIVTQRSSKSSALKAKTFVGFLKNSNSDIGFPHVDTRDSYGFSWYFNKLYQAYRFYAPSVRLANIGSAARDHLANERTYLAWLRTSFASISAGVTISQFFRLNKTKEDSVTSTSERAFRSLFIMLGMVFLMFGFMRYFHCQITLVSNKFPASRGTIMASTSLTAMAIAAIPLVIIFKK